MRDKSKLSRVETQAAIEEQLSNVLEWKRKDLTLKHVLHLVFLSKYFIFVPRANLLAQHSNKF